MQFRLFVELKITPCRTPEMVINNFVETRCLIFNQIDTVKQKNIYEAN